MLVLLLTVTLSSSFLTQALRQNRANPTPLPIYSFCRLVAVGSRTETHHVSKSLQLKTFSLGWIELLKSCLIHSRRRLRERIAHLRGIKHCRGNFQLHREVQSQPLSLAIGLDAFPKTFSPLFFKPFIQGNIPVGYLVDVSRLAEDFQTHHKLNCQSTQNEWTNLHRVKGSI